MNRRCPACGALFPETAQFCDQDGKPLLPAKRSGGGKVWIGTLAALLLTGLVTLPFLIQHFVRWKVDVVLEGVRLEMIGRPGIREGSILQTLGELFNKLALSDEPPRLTLQLKVRNGSPLLLSVRSARYVVKVGERQVAAGVWIPEYGSSSITPSQELPIELALRLQPEFKVDQEWLRHPPMLHVSGDFALEIFGQAVTLPFEVRRVEFGGILEPGASPSRSEVEPGLDSRLRS